MGGTRELPCATWQACPILLQCFLQSLWAAIRPPSPSLSGLSNYDQFLSPIIVQALRRDSQAPCRDATDRRGCLSRGRRSTQSLLEEAQYTTYQTSHSSLLTYHCHHSCQASLTAPLLTPHLSHLTHHFSLTIVTTHVKHHSPLHFSPPRVAGAVHKASWRSCGACGRRWGRGCLSTARVVAAGAPAAFRVAGAVHRASWRSCGARGRRWGRGCL